jgi:putative restriction endonuclease
VSTPSLSGLLRKAAGDAGFDLDLDADGGWRSVRVSGVPGGAWVRPVGGGALLALPAAGYLSEIDAKPTVAEPLPTGAAVAVACASPGELFRALRRVRLLLVQSPPLPEMKLAQRLAAITSTEAEAVVRQRVGQGLFREALLEYWDGRCAVTGLDVPELLRASHAKPWKDATDTERLDVHNGLLLVVHLDALFDRGLLAFADDGTALLSPQLPAAARATLGLHGAVPPLRLSEGHLPYLEYHRTHVFRSATSSPPINPRCIE